MKIAMRVSVLAFLAFTGVECFTFHPSLRVGSSFISTRQHKSLLYSEQVNGETDTTSAIEEEPAAEIPPASVSVDSSKQGPFDVHTLTVNLGPNQRTDAGSIIIETGKIGRQAAGSVTLTRGDSVLYATASRDDSPKEEIDFLPLSVEHQERFSSAGMTSGAYNKRDGRPAEHEILVCRLIDRPLRPLIADGWRHETQLLSWVISYDGIRSCDPLAITASATALYLSDIPLDKPVAAVEVGYIDDVFVLNPTMADMERSRLDLTVAGTKDAVLMIEGAADFLPEAIMMEAVQFGHEAIKTLCDGIEQLGRVAGKEKMYDTIVPPPEGLQERVDELMMQRVDDMYNMIADKEEMGKVMSQISKAVVEELEEEYPDDKVAIKKAFKDLLCRRLFEKANKEGIRCDGRKLDEVRRLDMEAGFLPRVHGSALFTRGETQTIATTTLGDSGMKQRIDKIAGQEEKRFYLQYSFPPSCVGETGRVGAPGRREVGHGNLAERYVLSFGGFVVADFDFGNSDLWFLYYRALSATLPSEEDFPYTIRVESLITESHGSSSMASVCGGSLALMDAGVPIKAPVAGIAMGMLLDDKAGVSDENAVILSDILGTEDALGTMDFKVAGDREGITTFQLDIKCEGLTYETMERALAQAREGRLHILDAMDQVLPAPRKELPPSVPKMARFSIPADSIGKVIGPGGRQIRAVIEDFNLVNMDVAEDGSIQLTSMDSDKLTEAETFVKSLVAGGGGGPGGGKGKREPRPKYQGPEPEVGAVYKGKITGIHSWGVFLEILPGAEDGSYPGLEGLCHVSELHVERVRNCEGFVNSLNTDELEVKYLGINDKGQLRLSRRAILEENLGLPPRDMDKKGGGRGPPEEAPTPQESKMSEDEVDVIAAAIEDVQGL